MQTRRYLPSQNKRGDIYMKVLSKKEVIGNCAMFDQLISINRWSSCMYGPRYAELGKQALNSAIAYFLAAEAENEGKKINWELFPRIAIHRGFEKTVLVDIREDDVERIFYNAGLPINKFFELIEREIAETTSNEFREWLEVPEDCLEKRIYRAATKLATRLELWEASRTTAIADYSEKLKEIEGTLGEFYDLPGFSRMALECSAEMKIFRKISSLRNRIRWQKRICTVPCSVLGHLFEVGVLGYLLALEKYQDEAVAARCFFIGIFHDLPEAWTGDMPSPIKDAIPGLRQATENFENDRMNRHVYQKLPVHLSTALHLVMMEEADALEYKPLMKCADYLSADLECMRQRMAGNRDPYFRDVLQNDVTVKKAQFSTAFQVIFEEAEKLLK